MILEDYLEGTFFGEVKEKSFAAQTQEEKESEREKHPARPSCDVRVPPLFSPFSGLIN